MNIVENKDAEAILKLFVHKNILELKPVIAGGFVVMLYNHVIKNQDDNTQRILSQISNGNLNYPKLLQDFFGPMITKDIFGDIDFWFLITIQFGRIILLIFC